MTVSDTLTILTAQIPLAKTVKRVEDSSLQSHHSPLAKSFNVSEVSVQSIHDVFDVLRGLQLQDSQAVIRGKLIAGRDKKNILRRSRARGEQPANFESAARRWVMIDVDDLVLRSEWQNVDASAEKIIAHTVRHLPVEFHSVKCVYQWSSSMGVKTDKIRVHLWYWLSRSTSDAELKAWLTGCPVDTALFQSVQLHYTANPIFCSGALDPIKTRVGLHTPHGCSDEVCVPDTIDVPNNPLSTRRIIGKQGVVDDQKVVRDPNTGLVVDGRERFMLFCSNQATEDVLRDSSDDIPSLEAIACQTWRLFAQEADLADGRWAKDHAVAEARRRHEDLTTGRYSFRSRNDHTILLPASDPFETSDFLVREEGQKRLEKALEQFFERLDKQPKLALRITTGAGKTRQTLQQLQQYLITNRGKSVEIYVPRHNLAQQYVKDIDAHGGLRAKVIHVLPRTSSSDGAVQGQCLRPTFAKSLTDAGLGVFRHACMSPEGKETCRHFHDCPYIQQFDELGDWEEEATAGNTVRIFVHAYLRLPRNQLQSDPDLVIIDEAFWQDLVNTNRTLTGAEIKQYVKTEQFPKLGRWIVDALEESTSLLEKLRAEGVDRDVLSQVDLTALQPNVAFSSQSYESAHHTGNPSLYYRLSTLLRILKEELARGRDQVERLVYDPKLGAIRLLEIHSPDIPDTAAVLVLDATADQVVLGKVFEDIRVERIDIHQQSVVAQVYDRTGSKAFWKDHPEEIAELVEVVNAWVAYGETPLVIGFKDIIESIKRSGNLSPEVRLNHFGALRGSNEAETCSVAFILGRMMPSPPEVDLQARAIFWDDKDPLQHDGGAELKGNDAVSEYLPTSLRGYLQTERNPKPQSGIRAPTFSDSRIDAVFRQIQDAETLQALGRLRMVHATIEKRVFLLSNLPVSIPVDHLVPFAELMPDRLELELIRKGHVPLTAKGLVKMRPDIVTNDSTARTWIDRSKVTKAHSMKMFPALANATILEATFRAGEIRLSEHRHLFLIDEKKEQGVLVGPVPDINDVKTLLEEGDPEIEGSGWEKIEDLKLGFWAAGL